MVRHAATYLCILLIFFFSAHHVHAYPSKRTGDTAKLLGEIARTSPVDVHKPLVLYDNLNYSSGKGTDDLPIFEKGCACLVPAEIINVNLNMTYLFHSPAKPPNDLLGSLIYANIELKNMLDQYKNIQKRAVEIAEAAGSPAYVDSPYSIYMPLPEVIIQYAADQAKTLKAEREAIVSTNKGKDTTLRIASKRVENSISRILSSTNGVIPLFQPAEQNLHQASKQDGDLAAPTSLNREANPEKFLNLASRNYSIGHFNTGYSSMAGQNQLSPAQHRKIQRFKDEKTVLDSSSDDLPWWISAPSQFITYCMNNKLEAGIMLIVFIFFMNIIGSIFRR